MTYQEECEAKGRALFREPVPSKDVLTKEDRRSKKSGRRYFRITGRLAGTVTIDNHGTISFRPLRRRKVYESTLEKVIGLMVTRLAMAEAVARAARKTRRAA